MFVLLTYYKQTEVNCINTD